MISIHALLAESDNNGHETAPDTIPISIHALLAESDSSSWSATATSQHFYPRSPCGERLRTSIPFRQCWNFYPRSPCGERQLLHGSESKGIKISIHALLAESDPDFRRYIGSDVPFLSTLSLRRATAKVHKTVGHFCAYETNFMGIASSC